MSFKTLTAGFGLAGFAAMGLALTAIEPARAGDLVGTSGSYKDTGGSPAVPVPAPKPIPDKSNYYLRGTIGYTASSSGTIETEGTNAGIYSSYSQLSGQAFYGAAAGYYVTPNVRVELSVDLQRQQNLGSGRTSNYWATKTQAGATTSVVGIVNTQTITLSTNSWDVNYYKVSQTDVPSDSNILPLFNLYYDIDTGTKFKPYVGAGAGLSITKVKRTNSTNANCDHTINTYIDPFSHNQVQTSLGNTCSSTTTTLPQQNYNSAAIQSVTNYGFAGALMTGLGYEIRPGITLDTGYRFLWSTNGPTTSAPSFASDGSPQPDTRTRLGDRFDHQILAGVRFDLQ